MAPIDLGRMQMQVENRLSRSLRFRVSNGVSEAEAMYGERGVVAPVGCGTGDGDFLDRGDIMSKLYGANCG